MIRFCFILSLTLLLSAALSAQFDEDPESIPDRPQDTIPAKLERGVLQTFKLIFEGKPGKAAFYSLVIPGGGQLYNKRYWKAPIVWAADGAAITWFVYNRREYKNFEEALGRKLAGEDISYRGISDSNGLRAYRNQFQLTTERAGIIVVALHLVSVIEAFTDRHLMNFDVDEDLSFQLKIENIQYSGEIAGIGMHYSF